MPSLDFITSNPATSAYLRQEKERRDQALAEARMGLMAGQTKHINQQTDFEAQSMPSRLRSIDAGATSAETEADVGVKTAPTRIEKADVGLRQAKTDLGSSEVEADVKRQTAPVRVQEARTGLRKANAEATNSELQGFYKSLDLLDQGDTEGAKRVAAASGQDLTDAHINDREMRGTLSRSAKRAQELYPNRPREQQTYIQARIDEMNERRANGQPVRDAQSEHTLPKGAPTPPEIAANPREHQPADIQIAEWLRTKGIAKTDEEAWRMARHARENPEAAYGQIYGAALRANGGDGPAAKQTADDFLKSRDLRTAPAAPAPAPRPAAPAQQRPEMMTPGNGTQPMSAVTPPGTGTREQPYQATAQEHIEWFKRSAPAGAVIVVNGVPYTK